MKLKSYKNPPLKKWSQIASAVAPEPQQMPRLAAILQAVESDGDPALRRIVKEARGRAPRSWSVGKRSMAQMHQALDEDAKSRLRSIKAAVAEVHRNQLPDAVYVRAADGVMCHRQPVPVRSIGICLGPDAAMAATAMIMIAVPARLAGCESICAGVAPGADGSFPPDVMYAASLCGIDNVYALHVEEAIAAMAVGTATVKRVDKLFVVDPALASCVPPGIARRVQCVGLSVLPGRILIVADDTAEPAAIAAMLVDCAGECAAADMAVVCASSRFALKVERALDKAMQKLPLGEASRAALERACMVIFEGDDFRFLALDFSNMYAPDQLLLMVHEPAELAEGVYAARTVQCGGDITMAQRMQCGINMLANAAASPDAAGVIGMADFMHDVDFITKTWQT